MSDTIPEYYQSLSEEAEKEVLGERTKPNVGSRDNRAESPSHETSRRYWADAFSFQLPGGKWTDQSVYTLLGPTVDGLGHTITITMTEPKMGGAQSEFADEGTEAILAELEDGRVLRKDVVELKCGRSAHRLIIVWYPEGGRRYLEQLYVLCDGQGYVLSAPFTRMSRRRIGTAVEHIMLSFTPERGRRTS